MKSNRLCTFYNKPYHFTLLQKRLIAELEYAGMTGAHLDTWFPNSENEDFFTLHVNHEIRVFDNRFTQKHSLALIALVKHHGLKPSHAINEINYLSADEAKLLTQYFAQGLRGSMIRNNSEHYAFSSPQFATTLNVLLSKKLAITTALSEMKDLSSNELQLLQDFYQHGLRGDMLRENRDIGAGILYETCRGIASLNRHQRLQKYKDAIEYYCAFVIYSIKEGASIAHAILQANEELKAVYANVATEIEGDVAGLIHHESKRLNFLRHHIKHGIKACHTDQVITTEQLKTYYVLKFMHGFSPLAAIKQVQGLSDDKVIFLRQHYGPEVNHQSLIAFQHHMAFALHYMKTQNVNAARAMKDLNQLSPNQLVYYYQLEDVGVTYDMAKEIPRNATYSQARVDTAKIFVNEMNYGPCQALKDVVEHNEEYLKEILQGKRLSRSQMII